MNEELRDLLSLRAAGIVRVSSRFDESASGHVETRTNQYVCRVDGKPLEIEVAWTTHFLGGSGTGFTVHSRTIISEEQYRAAIEGKTLIDSPTALAELAAEKELTAKRLALTPNCPKCGARMVPRSGKRGEFWGCPRYPACKGLLAMSPEYRALTRTRS